MTPSKQKKGSNRVAPGVNQFAQGLERIALRIKDVMERDRLLVTIRPRRCSPEQFVQRVETLSWKIAEALMSTKKIFDDCFIDNKSRIHDDIGDKRFVQSRLKMISDVFERIIRARRDVIDVEVDEYLADLRRKTIGVADSLLNEFVDFTKEMMCKVREAEEGKTGLYVKLVFDPTKTEEAAENVTHELERLNEDVRSSQRKCFVATAVFDDPACWQVRNLRYLRDEVLLKTWFGARLVRVYYTVGPSIAEGIGSRPCVKHTFAIVLGAIASCVPSPRDT